MYRVIITKSKAFLSKREFNQDPRLFFIQENKVCDINFMTNKIERVTAIYLCRVFIELFMIAMNQTEEIFRTQKMQNE